MKIEVVKGIYGHVALYITEDDGSGLRIAGPKPWGGGEVIHSFDVDLTDKRTREALIEALDVAKEKQA